MSMKYTRLNMRSSRIHSILYNSKLHSHYTSYITLNISAEHYKKNFCVRQSHSIFPSLFKWKKRGKILRNGCYKDIRWKLLSRLLLNKITWFLSPFSNYRTNLSQRSLLKFYVSSHHYIISFQFCHTISTNLKTSKIFHR